MSVGAIIRLTAPNLRVFLAADLPIVQSWQRRESEAIKNSIARLSLAGAMGADLLPRTATPGGYGAALLEFALAALTHRFPLVRRLSFALLLLLCCFAIVTTARVRRLAADPALQPRPHVEPVWHPVPQTPVQAVEYARLEALVHSKRSAYDPALFAARALAAESSNVVGVTAVVLHWKRRKGLQLVLEHISRYPYVREVIVWNNRGDVDLVASVSVCIR